VLGLLLVVSGSVLVLMGVTRRRGRHAA